MDPKKNFDNFLQFPVVSLKQLAVKFFRKTLVKISIIKNEIKA